MSNYETIEGGPVLLAEGNADSDISGSFGIGGSGSTWFTVRWTYMANYENISGINGIEWPDEIKVEVTEILESERDIAEKRSEVDQIIQDYVGGLLFGASGAWDNFRSNYNACIVR